MLNYLYLWDTQTVDGFQFNPRCPNIRYKGGSKPKPVVPPPPPDPVPVPEVSDETGDEAMKKAVRQVSRRKTRIVGNLRPTSVKWGF